VRNPDWVNINIEILKNFNIYHTVQDSSLQQRCALL